ncbi:hypothetical protein PHPALM_29704 [Phytophthora palmivora]|uniref:LRRK2 ARM repeat domain-containing protein n=1 Tax=Phytophthora palmivora TaxID=4796 RepID=A0A2P4X6Y0_9STRA|nr:hypothetical protein PHPALM_29704 [Phytophthora palmivora]
MHPSSQQLGVGDCVAVKPKSSVKKTNRVRSSDDDNQVEERRVPFKSDSKTPSTNKNIKVTTTRSHKASTMELTKQESSRPRKRGEFEDKGPETAATQRRARTAENTSSSKKREPIEAMHKPMPSRRQRDLSDSVAQTQKQVAEIMETITAAEADAVVVKNALSQLLRVIRSAPQITAECIHEQKGELILLHTIQTHSSHAVLLCYGCVLMRKLCHLSVDSVELFVHHGIIPTVAQALLSFPEDAILQASACGCLAVLTQTSDVSKNEMLNDPSILGLVLASLDIHRDYSNLTRQVQIYAFLTELCDYGGPSTVATLIAHDPRRKAESPIALAVALTRQSMAREDKKVTCSFCSLLLW